jgi:hypothetical protein
LVPRRYASHQTSSPTRFADLTLSDPATPRRFSAYGRRSNRVTHPICPDRTRFVTAWKDGRPGTPHRRRTGGPGCRSKLGLLRHPEPAGNGRVWGGQGNRAEHRVMGGPATITAPYPGSGAPPGRHPVPASGGVRPPPKHPIHPRHDIVRATPFAVRHAGGVLPVAAACRRPDHDLDRRESPGVEGDHPRPLEGGISPHQSGPIGSSRVVDPTRRTP